MEKTLFALDVATGCFTLASGLSDTVSFLQVLASIYKSSGIRAQRVEKAHVLPYAIDKVSYVNDNFTKTVSDVNERLSAKEAIATNGPEGTVFNKTQVSLKPLEEGMHCVCNSIASINNDNLEDTELCTLLTTVVEIIHVASLLSMRPPPHCSIPKTLE